MDQPATESQRAALAVIAKLRILQVGDARLRATAAPFRLPGEATTAEQTLIALLHAAEQLLRTGSFNNGIGLAAPQLGIPRQAAVVLIPGSGHPTTLLNPALVENQSEVDVPRYEGCLSFFGVSGRVTRPLVLTVSHQDLDGTSQVSTFTRAAARLVAHELDHLAGRLYVDRMAEGVEPVPVETDPESRALWRYPGGGAFD